MVKKSHNGEIDVVEAMLRDLPGGVWQQRKLTITELEALVMALGPRTVQNILHAKETYKLARIPFLFNSLDSQQVIDILVNDESEILKICQKDSNSLK